MINTTNFIQILITTSDIPLILINIYYNKYMPQILINIDQFKSYILDTFLLPRTKKIYIYIYNIQILVSI